MWYAVLHYVVSCVFFFFFKQKTAYEMRISDWSSDVCSSDLEKEMKDMANAEHIESHMAYNEAAKPSFGNPEPLKSLDELMEEKESAKIGRASCRERVCQYV